MAKFAAPQRTVDVGQTQQWRTLTFTESWSSERLDTYTHLRFVPWGCREDAPSGKASLRPTACCGWLAFDPVARPPPLPFLTTGPLMRTWAGS